MDCPLFNPQESVAHENKTIDFKGSCDECDGFEMANTRSNGEHIKLIKNMEKQYLSLDEEQQLMFADKKTDQLEDCRFKIHRYMDSTPSRPPAVILSTCIREMVIECCSENCPKAGVHPVEGDVPETISQDQHKAVFFLEKVNEQEGTYRVESSLFRSWYLGYDLTQCGKPKLMLRKETEEVDERVLVILQSPVKRK